MTQAAQDNHLQLWNDYRDAFNRSDYQGFYSNMMKSRRIALSISILMACGGLAVAQGHASEVIGGVKYWDATWATLRMAGEGAQRIEFVRMFPYTEGATSPRGFWQAKWYDGDQTLPTRQIDSHNCPGLVQAIDNLAHIQPVELVPTGARQVAPPSPHGALFKLQATGAFANNSYAMVEITDYGGGDLTKWYAENSGALLACK